MFVDYVWSASRYKKLLTDYSCNKSKYAIRNSISIIKNVCKWIFI